MPNNIDNAMAAYIKLRDKLIGIAKGDVQYSKEANIPLNTDSTNHHYVPKYHVDGFLNDSGLLYRYDKDKDRIIKNPQGSKGVFFEEHRNSLSIDATTKVSLFEAYYTVIDTLLPVALKLLRKRASYDKVLLSELYEHLDILLIDLYWRNPNTDSLFDKLFDSASVTLNEIPDVSETVANQIKTTPGLKQLCRIQIVQQTMEHVQSYINQGHSIRKSMVDYNIPQFCLGDMPFVMRYPASNHTDLISMPLIVPISSTKLYVRNIPDGRIWDSMTANILNALIIRHSTKMVVCSNKQILEQAIKTFHSLKDNQHIVDHCMVRLFGDE
jgi:hypothetical protein